MGDRKILVRFDDICPTMDFTQFRIAMEWLDRYNIKPLIGIIPDCKDPDLKIEQEHYDFWDFVLSLQSKGYSIAMHGCHHVFDSNCRGLLTKRIGSEFAGHPLDVQIEKIQKGIDILNTHGLFTNVFFAPAHSYDENTVKALAANGFNYISDGKSSLPYIWHGIKFLPDRDAGCPRIGCRRLYTAVFHAHEWTRPDKQYSFADFKNLLNNYKEDIVSFQEYAGIESGNYTVQRCIEKGYCIYEQSLKPALVRIKRKFIVK